MYICCLLHNYIRIPASSFIWSTSENDAAAITAHFVALNFENSVGTYKNMFVFKQACIATNVLLDVL